MVWRDCGRSQRRNCASGLSPMRDGKSMIRKSGHRLPKIMLKQRSVMAPHQKKPSRLKFNLRPDGRFWEVRMKLKAWIAGTIVSGIVAGAWAATASAENTVY